MDRLHHNIPKLYIIKASKWLMLLMPVIVVFFKENDLTMHQVFLVKAIGAVAIVGVEIPSGYFADVWGRKTTLIIGTIFGFVGFAGYAMSWQFLGFAIAEILLGIGTSLISGADSALLYDTLLAKGRSDDYLRQEGRMTSVGNFAEAAGGLIGGALALYTLRTPAVVQAVLAFAAIPAALTLVEPDRNPSTRKPTFGHILAIVRYALVEQPTLRWSILLSAVMGLSTLTMAWFVQPIFSAINLPLALYGPLWTALNLCVGLVAWQSHSIRDRLGIRGTSWLFLVGISAVYGLMGAQLTYLTIGLLFIFYLTRGVATPVLRDCVNRVTPSEMRATVLSVRSFIIRGLFVGVGPFLGWLTDHTTLRLALSVAGMSLFVLAAIALSRFLHHWPPTK